MSDHKTTFLDAVSKLQETECLSYKNFLKEAGKSILFILQEMVFRQTEASGQRSWKGHKNLCKKKNIHTETFEEVLYSTQQDPLGSEQYLKVMECTLENKERKTRILNNLRHSTDFQYLTPESFMEHWKTLITARHILHHPDDSREKPERCALSSEAVEQALFAFLEAKTVAKVLEFVQQKFPDRYACCLENWKNFKKSKTPKDKLRQHGSVRKHKKFELQNMEGSVDKYIEKGLEEFKTLENPEEETQRDKTVRQRYIYNVIWCARKMSEQCKVFLKPLKEDKALLNRKGYLKDKLGKIEQNFRHGRLFFEIEDKKGEYLKKEEVFQCIAAELSTDDKRALYKALRKCIKDFTYKTSARGTKFPKRRFKGKKGHKVLEDWKGKRFNRRKPVKKVFTVWMKSLDVMEKNE